MLCQVYSNFSSVITLSVTASESQCCSAVQPKLVQKTVAGSHKHRLQPLVERSQEVNALAHSWVASLGSHGNPALHDDCKRCVPVTVLDGKRAAAARMQ